MTDGDVLYILCSVQAHHKLEDIERELESSSGALRSNFGEFTEWHAKIKKDTQSNKETAHDINRDFESAINQYHKMLIQNERAIADKAFHHIQGKDGVEGLSKNEFDDLLIRLPPRWKLAFKRLDRTFEDFAGDDDIIDHSEFRLFMDEMAKDIANCGMDKERLRSMGLRDGN